MEINLTFFLIVIMDFYSTSNFVMNKNTFAVEVFMIADSIFAWVDGISIFLP